MTAVVAGALVVVAVGILALVLRSDHSSELSAQGTGSERTVAVSELRSEVNAAAEALVGGPGFEAARATTFEGRLVRALWMRHASNGDFEAVQFSDVDGVREMASFGGPRPETETLDDPSVSESFVVGVGNEVYRGIGGGRWEELQVSTSFKSPLGIDLELMARGDYVDSAVEDPGTDALATVQDTLDGGMILTLRTSHGGEETEQTWGIGPNGVLRSYSYTTDLLAGRTAVEFTFVPLPTDPSFLAPVPGSAVDASRFAVPSDLPRP